VPNAVADLTEAELVKWGEEFGRSLRLPACVVLVGDLGAGKTTLVRAIARALGTLEPVTSPTYNLVHEYSSPRGHVFHLDLYRLRDAEQLHQLGWEDIQRHGGLIIVEWPDRAADALPEPHLTLRLEHIPGRPDQRRLSW
jgi:tRNA threonylcarbamoyladenosine biosynthesis protein TsaE